MTYPRLIARFAALAFILVDAALAVLNVAQSATTSSLNAALPIISLLTLAGIGLNLFSRTSTRGALVIFAAIVAKLIILGPASFWQGALIGAGLTILVVSRSKLDKR